MVSIICVESENAGNLGAVCRAMKNFGFKNLILINPKVSPQNDEAIRRAKHANEILSRASICGWDVLKKFNIVAGTTAQVGSYQNIPRNPLSPEQFAELVKEKKGKIALIIGRDGSGLTNEELKKCDFVVSIPTSRKYPAMNISHAVAIILYELFKKSGKEKITSHIKIMNSREKDALIGYITEAINKLEFETPEKKETQKNLWRRIIGKSMLTRKEAFALCGFFRKIR
ncbi:MAG TPA: RNA methyltransferase [Candidatus Nanoarchaeia archaeon]|nr:RNA methyltransferase [Candidatus Nanoarchaeia archaeon]